jgi:MFS family permease
MRGGASSVRRNTAGLATVFFLLGFIGASWISRIPRVQADLHLSNGLLGAALVGLPVGSVAASLALPAAVERWDGHRVVAWTLPASAAALCLPGFARDTFTLALSLVLLGAATGGLDVAMNTHGVRVEDAVGRSVFARLHALWSLGGFFGAGLGVLLQHEGVSPRRHLVLVALVVGTAGLLVPRLLSALPSTDAPATGRTWSKDRTVLTLATVAVAAFVVEVAAADWGGVFLHRVVGASSTTSAAAFAAFALPHFLVRMLGDPILDRVRTRSLMIVTLSISAVGFLVLTMSSNAWSAFAGLALAGAGVGLVVPVGFAAAGRVEGVPRGAGVATAAGIAYVAWAATPPLIGGVSSMIGLRNALLLAPVLAVGAAVVVARSRSV